MSRDSLARISCTRPGSEYDELTPPCRVCGEANVGVNTETTLMLKGSYVFSPEHGVALFVLDPDVSVSIMELPSGQLALACDIGSGADSAHTECIDRIVSYLFEDDKDEDEADLEDEDDVEYDDYADEDGVETIWEEEG